MSDRMMLLDTTTGLVHKYEGTGPGGIECKEKNHGIGVIPCDCDGTHAELFEECLENNNAIVIYERQFEAGIWKAAPCVENHD